MSARKGLTVKIPEEPAAANTIAQDLIKINMDNRPAIFVDRFAGSSIDTDNWNVVSGGTSVEWCV